MALANEKAHIMANECVGPNLYVMTARAPYVAQNARPGQFVHMRIPRMEAHVLRRPFGVYARDAQKGTIDMLYQTVGFGSTHMATLEAGESIELIGPVGRGWNPPDDLTHALIVAGGVGASPLFMLCEMLVAQGVSVDAVLGAQTKDALVCRKRYESLLGCCPRCSTDDGTYGRAGFCTMLVQEALDQATECGTPYGYVAVCGPEPLMRIVAGMAHAAHARCEVSMERRMACGIGACLSCVVDTVAGKRRACVDGPVFDAQEVVWP